jgi:hypothetical protein
MLREPPKIRLVVLQNELAVVRVLDSKSQGSGSQRESGSHHPKD